MSISIGGKGMTGTGLVKQSVYRKGVSKTKGRGLGQLTLTDALPWP